MEPKKKICIEPRNYLKTLRRNTIQVITHTYVAVCCVMVQKQIQSNFPYQFIPRRNMYPVIYLLIFT